MRGPDGRARGTALRCLLLACGMFISLRAASVEDAGSPDRPNAALAMALPAAPTVLVAPESGRLLALDVILNETALGTWPVLEVDGAHYVTMEALTAWRLHVPAGSRPLTFRQRLWWPLFAVPGYRAILDFSQQSLAIQVAVAAFSPTQITPPPMRAPIVSGAVPSAFLNYDVSGIATHGPSGTRSQDVGLLTEIGASLAQGMLLSTQVQRVSRGTGVPSASLSVRLETAWIRDWPDRGTTLRLGDGWTRASTWGRTAAFGGVQLGTNTGLAPSFSTRALPVLSGSAVAPSTVELYVNEVLRQTLNVPPGPFTLDNPSQLNGAGEARVVVRDVLGRESVLVQPFFTHTSLLAPGMAQWSVEAGQLRRDLGVASNDYGGGFAQGLLLRGITNRLTVEGRAQGGRGLANAGAGATFLVADRVLAQAAVAGSSATGWGQGASVLIGAGSQGLRDGASLRFVASSRDYRELGLADAERPNRVEASAALRLGIGATDSVGLNLALIRRQAGFQPGSAGVNGSGLPVLGFAAGSDTRTATLSYTQRFGSRGTLVWSATRVAGSLSATNLQVQAVIPLGGRVLGTASMGRVNGHLDGYGSATTPVDGVSGWGWRALAGHRAEESYAEAGVLRQSDRWLATLDASAGSRASAVRGSAQGALVAMEGQIFTSRRLQDGYALVEVPGHPGIGIGLVGPSLVRTDERGRALLPNLAAYQVNRIRLDANDLAPSAELETLEMNAVPPWRGGVKIVFPVRSGRSALLRFVIAGDEPAPVGAVVTVEGDDSAFLVGRRGESYVTGLADGSVATLSWKGQRCLVNVTLPPPGDELTRVGPLRCPDVQP